jgi:hypothetical protein
VTTPEQARRDLERLKREGETLGASAMATATPEVKPEDDDGIERLGKRIGRTMAFAAIPFVIWYFGRNAGWW